MAAPAELRIHHFLPLSYTNGPGARAVIWVQGCSLGCPGCFNPETHPTRGGEQLSIDTLFDRITALGNTIEGITLSGGEPLQQRPAVTHLLRRIRLETPLSTLLFSGFTWEEIQRMGRGKCGGVEERKSERRKERTIRSGASSLPLLHSSTPPAPEFLPYLDVLIAGRYDQEQRLAHGLRGSDNKTAHFFTGRYTPADLEAVPPAEVILGPDGEIVLSGIDPIRW
jgi:anaerobic ribonucleoside-triphosphate reductase activating protein